MKKIKLFVFMMLGMSCLFQSCKNDLEQLQQENTISDNYQAFENERRQKFATNAVDESIKGDFELREGILHFKNVATYIKLRDSFIDKNMSERAAFAEKNGFESRLSVTFKALEKIRNTKSKEEYKSLIAQNIDFVAYDEVTQLAVSRIGDDCAASILNKDGLVYMGKVLYKFANGKEYIIFDGDMNKLSSLKNSRVGESLEVAEISTNQSNKNAKICSYWGVIGWSTNPNYGDRSGKMEYKVDGLIYYYEPNNNPSKPWRVQGHGYVKGSAACPDGWGGRTDYWTWNRIIVNYRLQLFDGNSVVESARVGQDKLEAGYGTDIHSYVNGNISTLRAVDIVINDGIEIPYSIINKYNWAEAGPNQWLEPNDCHWYPVQW
jgi:hypothetical protein